MFISYKDIFSSLTIIHTTRKKGQKHINNTEKIHFIILGVGEKRANIQERTIHRLLSCL